MSTYTYDDGSTISYDGRSVSSTPAIDAGVGGWTQDSAEADKLARFYPQGAPWWQQLATYGATRAIDAHYKRAEADRTAQPITFAGQNGRTYAAGATEPGMFGGAGGGGLLLLGLVAVAAIVLTKG